MINIKRNEYDKFSTRNQETPSKVFLLEEEEIGYTISDSDKFVYFTTKQFDYGFSYLGWKYQISKSDFTLTTASKSIHIFFSGKRLSL